MVLGSRTAAGEELRLGEETRAVLVAEPDEERLSVIVEVHFPRPGGSPAWASAMLDAAQAVRDSCFDEHPSRACGPGITPPRSVRVSLPPRAGGGPGGSMEEARSTAKGRGDGTQVEPPQDLQDYLPTSQNEVWLVRLHPRLLF